MHNGDGYGGYDPPQHPAHNSRVKVEDALTYLDQVKTQFGNEPQVYTQFLDIMKDFKSQTIDTPGVIMRVSSLFAGKPHLITGFNQFLPAGFEVTIEQDNIIISEPNGQRKVITVGGVITILPAPSYTNYMDVIAQEVENEYEDEDEEMEEQLMESEETLEDQPEEPEEPDTAVSTEESAEEEEEQEEATGELEKYLNLPIELPNEIDARTALDQSVTFINKIKSRFDDEGYTYNQFLTLLQDYYSGIESEKAILDTITTLLEDEEDLLEEFRIFLPVAHGTHQKIPLVEEKQPSSESECGSEEDESDEQPEDASDEENEVEEQEEVAEISEEMSEPSLEEEDKEKRDSKEEIGECQESPKIEAPMGIEENSTTIHGEKEDITSAMPVVNEQRISEEKKAINEAVIENLIKETAEGATTEISMSIEHAKSLEELEKEGVKEAAKEMVDEEAEKVSDEEADDMGKEEEDKEESAELSERPEEILLDESFEQGDALIQTDEGVFHIGPVQEKTVFDERGHIIAASKPIADTINDLTLVESQGNEEAMEESAEFDEEVPISGIEDESEKDGVSEFDSDEDIQCADPGVEIITAIEAASTEQTDSDDYMSDEEELLLSTTTTTTDEESNSDDLSTESDLDLSDDKPFFPLDRRQSGEVIRSIDGVFFELFEVVQRNCTEDEFDTFMRAMNLYSTSVISATELLALVKPVIGALPRVINKISHLIIKDDRHSTPRMVELSEEKQINIDFATCRQLGISYRSLPQGTTPPICSGRTELCQSVLNDYWVSYPCWLSEDTSVVSSKKTPYEDFVCKTEDERFELDIIIENNKYAIDSLEGVKRRINRMSTLEQEKFKLDDKMGASSGTLMAKAIRRIYGEHASKIFDALKKNPCLTVPKILERMKEREREWREAQETMNKIWREQNDRYMAKSLDHQANALRTSDAKWLKAKQIVHQMEVLFDERQTKFVEGLTEDEGPHAVITYPIDKEVLLDVNDLIMHHVNRQSYPHHEKLKIKYVLDRYIPEWFFLDSPNMLPSLSDEEGVDEPNSTETIESEQNDYEDKYFSRGREILLYGGNALLVFIRVHHIMCERLAKIKETYKQNMSVYEDEQFLQETRRKIYQEQGNRCLTHELNVYDMQNGLPELRSFGKIKTPHSAYNDFLMECKGFIEGSIEAPAFEDSIRVLFPLDCYLLFSVDKMVSVITRQLHPIAMGTDIANCIDMYEKYRITPPFNSTDDSDFKFGTIGSYSDEAEEKMNCQNCFKIVFLDEVPLKLAIELVDTETGEDINLGEGGIIVKQSCEEAYDDEEEDAEDEEEMEDEDGENEEGDVDDENMDDNVDDEGELEEGVETGDDEEDGKTEESEEGYVEDEGDEDECEVMDVEQETGEVEDEEEDEGGEVEGDEIQDEEEEAEGEEIEGEETQDEEVEEEEVQDEEVEEEEIQDENEEVQDEEVEGEIDRRTEVKEEEEIGDENPNREINEEESEESEKDYVEGSETGENNIEEEVVDEGEGEYDEVATGDERKDMDDGNQTEEGVESDAEEMEQDLSQDIAGFDLEADQDEADLTETEIEPELENEEEGMDRFSPRPSTSQSPISSEEFEEPIIAERRPPLFLMRNIRSKHRKNAINKKLHIISGEHFVQSNRWKLSITSTEGFMKRPWSGQNSASNEWNYWKRKERMDKLFRLTNDNEETESSWLDKDTIRRRRLKENFLYISYTEYLLKPSADTSM